MKEKAGKIDYERLRAVKAKQSRQAKSSSQPDITTKSVTVKLVDTYHKVAEVRGFKIESDEPEAIGGKNAAPQPTEFMLMSLAFCQAGIITGVAAGMHVQLDDIEITVKGTRDSRGLRGLADVRPGYFKVEMETKLFSAEPKEKLEKLAQVAEKRCPVHDNLSNPTPVTNRVTRGDELLLESASAD